MFEAEALGLTNSQYQQAAISLVTPVLGFLFLFLLGLPLKKIPFIDAIEDYTPPRWVLPAFALGSLFIFSLCISTSLFLTSFRSSTSEDYLFLHEFYLTRNIDVPPDSGELEIASITLGKYDGLSNFRLYVNGYRMLGSSSDCLLSYQCKASDAIAANDLTKLRDLQIIDHSIHHVHTLYSLRFSFGISDHLVAGLNFIDINSENSGLGQCNLGVITLLSFSKIKITDTINIEPGVGANSENEIRETSNTAHMRTFFAEGDPSKREEELIEPYRTHRSEQTNRLCERIRLFFELPEQSLEKVESERIDTLLQRHRDLFCEVVNYARRYCKKAQEKAQVAIAQ